MDKKRKQGENSNTKLSIRNIKKNSSNSYLNSFLETKIQKKKLQFYNTVTKRDPITFEKVNPALWPRNPIKKSPIQTRNSSILENKKKTSKKIKVINKINSLNTNASKRISTSEYSEFSYKGLLSYPTPKTEDKNLTKLSNRSDIGNDNNRLRCNSAEDMMKDENFDDLGSKKLIPLGSIGDEFNNEKIFKTANPEVIETLENFLESYNEKNRKKVLERREKYSSLKPVMKEEEVVKKLKKPKSKSTRERIIKNENYSSASILNTFKTPKNRIVTPLESNIKSSKKSVKKKRVKKKVKSKSKSKSRSTKKNKILNLENLKKTLKLNNLSVYAKDKIIEETIEEDESNEVNSNIMNTQIKKTLKLLKKSGIMEDELRKIEVILLSFLNFAMNLENRDLELTNKLGEKEEEIEILKKKVEELKVNNRVVQEKFHQLEREKTDLEGALEKMKSMDNKISTYGQNGQNEGNKESGSVSDFFLIALRIIKLLGK